MRKPKLSPMAMVVAVVMAVAALSGGAALTGGFDGVLPDQADDAAVEAVAAGQDEELEGEDLEGEDLEGEDLTTEVHNGDHGEGPDENAADVAKALYAYISTTEDTGCQFGQTVAAIAQGGSADDAQLDRCEGTDEEGLEGGENAVDGSATASDKSGGRSDSGEANAEGAEDEGRTTATDKSGGRSDSGEANADGAGDDEQESAGQGGQEKASDASGGRSDGRPSDDEG